MHSLSGRFTRAAHAKLETWPSGMQRLSWSIVCKPEACISASLYRSGRIAGVQTLVGALQALMRALAEEMHGSQKS